MAMRVHRSSGNVFRDLGFSDDEDRRMRRTGRGGHPRNKR
jgi:hypothetical protein